MNSSKILLLDVGNTNIKWGVSFKNELVETGAVLISEAKDSGFSFITRSIPKDINRVLASNVSSMKISTRLSAAIGASYGCNIEFVNKDLSSYGVTTEYSEPRQLGVDRWVAMIAARSEFNGEIAVIDAGTAVTIDFVNKKGIHIGGQILPGLHLMLKALDNSTRNISTSDIKEDTLQQEIELWAKDTTSAVISGAYNALCGAIIRSINNLKETDFKPKVILTGGDARFLMNFLDKSYLYRPNLVLNGLSSIAKEGNYEPL